MPQHALDRLDVGPLGEEEAGASVPQIVDTRLHSGPRAHRIPAGDWNRGIQPRLRAWWEEYVREAHDGDDEGLVQTAARNIFYERRRQPDG
jgi:hypothetical protein